MLWIFRVFQVQLCFHYFFVRFYSVFIVSCPNHFILLGKNSDFSLACSMHGSFSFSQHVKQFIFLFLFVSSRYHCYIIQPCQCTIF